MNNWLKRSQDWLLPRCCLLCFDPSVGADLCPRCLSLLPRIARACQGCGIPLATGRLCGVCLKRPRLVDRVCIPYRYEPPLSGLIWRLKFQHRVEVAAPLAQLLLEPALVAGISPNVILPVPLHPARMRQRGFNQALEIARPLSRALGVPLAPTLAVRARATAAQSTLGNPTARRRNVRGAFAVDRRRLQGVGHLVIVDDVVTSGATIAELARALRHAGVGRIDLLCLARAVPS